MCHQTYLEIKSTDRVAGSISSTNYRVTLPTSIVNIKKVTLISASIPNVIYNISTALGNNRISWVQGVGSFSAIIPDGNYTTTTLATQLAASMNAQDSNNYQFAFSTTTFNTTVWGNLAFQLLFSAANTAGMAKVLGFNPVDTSAGTSTTGSKAWNLSQPYTYYLSISQFGVPAMTSGNEACTFLLTNNANSGDLINFSLGEQFLNRVETKLPSLQAFDVALKTTKNVYVDLMNLDWSFTLLIETGTCGCK